MENESGAMAKVLGNLDMMKKILGHLGVGDRTRMRVVCKLWREILTRDDIPVAPEHWMVVCKDSYSKPEFSISEIRFRSVESKRVKIYRFRIPVEKFKEGFGLLGQCRQMGVSPRLWHQFALSRGLWLRRWCCCGSSRGWLLMAGGRFLRTTEMYLWNPISGATRKLPPISTLPFFRYLDQEAYYGWDDRISSFVKRVQVFPVGPEDCAVAILLSDRSKDSVVLAERTMDELGVCTTRDSRWSVVEGQHEYKDIIFHRGRLVASIECGVEERIGFEVERKEKVVWKAKKEMDLSGWRLVVELACFVYSGPRLEEEEEEEEEMMRHLAGLCRLKRARIEEHLVECSITGELLLVSAILDANYYLSCGYDQGPVESFRSSQTSGFEVRLVGPGDRLQRLSYIGKQDIYVGPSESVAVADRDRDSSIHFFTLDAWGSTLSQNPDPDNRVCNIRSETEYDVREYGYFCIPHNRRQTYTSTNLSSRLHSFAGWFQPKLF